MLLRRSLLTRSFIPCHLLSVGFCYAGICALSCPLLLLSARPSRVAGAFRAAFHAQLPWDGVECADFVCKFAKDPATPKSMYFNDVEAHEVAALYAKSFSAALNSGSGSGSSRKQYPPVSYVAAFIVEFVDKPGRPVCGCEQALPGTFRKYNNNVGAVCAIAPEDANELRARAAAASAAAAAAAASGLPAPAAQPSPLDNWDPQATAQAFSHYSFAQSSAQLLICDIQGVANRFTDPQIHTLSGKGFGLGNLGQTGIRAFLLRHACTDICRACGLTPVRAKDLNEKTIIPNFNGVPLHLNVGAVANAGAGSTGAGAAREGAGGMQQPQQRRQTSVDHSSHSSARSSGTLPSAAASAVSSAAASPAVASRHAAPTLAAATSSFSERDRDRERDRSYPPSSSASATPSASRSPSSSPRGSGSSKDQQQFASGLRGSPPVAATRAPPPVKKPALDDSDEALMASIMGE